ncbi:MAG: flagellar hook-associated protein FlgK [Xanthobacteraceae bacterium]|nr:MAG: flagellar hook-associated protein FlgK [Xanthobacteraceae bacterium]
MSLSQALTTALSGLRANQVGLSLVSANVANAETPGYIRKTVNQVTTTSGDIGASVRIAGVNRELDQYVQRQLRTETSGSGYAGLRATFLDRLQAIYGTPGAQGTLESALGSFTSALQALSTSSDSSAARSNVIYSAQALAQQLNTTTEGIQSLRNDAEMSISDAVNVANNAMRQIAIINNQLRSSTKSDAPMAALLDQRDSYIDQLSQLMDVRVVNNEANQVTVFTSSGVELVGAEASRLDFDAHGTLTPNTVWSSNPADRNVGALTLTFAHGGTLDLIGTKALRSGQMAALLELRDTTLVQAQAQVDQLAAAMASALSDKTTDGVAASSGAQTGFDLDLSGLQAGNVVHLTYTDNAGPTTHTVSIVRVDDPSVLPLPNSATNDPNDQVIGVDFSGGMASVVSQLNAALGAANIQFSNPAGSTLRVLDDGAGGLSDVTAASTTTTATSLTSGDAELPLFTDGGNLYTGAFTATGAQQTGFAGRITVNAALVGDPSKLVNYGASTASGDTTRPDFLYQQLTTGSFLFSSQTGVGTASSPFKGTLAAFTQQFISAQGEAASSADQLKQGQDVVMNTLKEKFNATSGVNIDEEMAHLLALQNAYAANARVMSVIKDMFQALLQT